MNGPSCIIEGDDWVDMSMREVCEMVGSLDGCGEACMMVVVK